MTWAATRFGFSLSVIPGALMLLTASCGTAGLGLSGSSEGGATRPGSGDGGRTGSKDATTDQGGGGSLVPDGGLLSSEGGPGQCVPRTCTELSATCGPMGDGCGGVIQCGNCTAPATCGGGGKPSNCGGNTSCIPKTCTDLGATCGPAVSPGPWHPNNFPNNERSDPGTGSSSRGEGARGEGRASPCGAKGCFAWDVDPRIWIPF